MTGILSLVPDSSASPTSGPEVAKDRSHLHPEAGPVVWAIDAFPDDPELQLKTALAIQATYYDCSIQPVYVLSEDAFLDRGYASGLKPALKPMAFKAVLRILGETHLRNLRRPRILIENSSSKEACARRLLRYSRKLGARVIALGSHARRGLPRFFAGNFVDTLIDSGPIPVLIAGPQTTGKRAGVEGAKTIVFPTDFSPACLAIFENVLELASSMGARVHVYHQEMPSFDPLSQANMSIFASGWVSMETFPAEAYLAGPQDFSRDIEAWRKRAGEMNVGIRFIRENFGESTSGAIVEYVKKLNESSALLVMASQTGPVASTLLGSVTRDVIRTSPCPIFVVPKHH